MAKGNEVPTRPGGASGPEERVGKGRHNRRDPFVGGSEDDRGKQGEIEKKAGPDSGQRGRTDRSDYEDE